MNESLSKKHSPSHINKHQGGDLSVHFRLMRKPIFLLLCLLFCQSAFGQAKLQEKADKLYRAKNYTEAAALYEKVLAEKSSLSIKTKLANCYRVNNRTERAEALYAEITAEKKAKAKTYFYYGEMLMSNGKYAAAKTWLDKYLKEEPGDEAAQLLLEACDFVPSIQPYFANVRVVEFPGNSEADDNTPVLWRDKLVFSSDRSKGMTQKSGWTGRNFINIFYSEKTDTSYTEPKVFSGKLSETNKNTGNPSFTADASRIYFTRNGVELSRRSIYNLSLFTAEAAGETRWKNVEILPFSSKEYNFMHPAISPDGKELYFVSDKPNGQGGTDIWVTRKTEKGWSRTQNLGPRVNTAANEGYPFTDGKGRLYFCSKGHPGYGGFDIFMTEKDAAGNWKTPVNLGRPVNSPRDDISIFLYEDEKGGMFTSNRSGGDDDIYFFTVTNEPIAEKEEIAENIPMPDPFPLAEEEIKKTYSPAAPDSVVTEEIISVGENILVSDSLTVSVAANVKEQNPDTLVQKTKPVIAEIAEADTVSVAQKEITTNAAPAPAEQAKNLVVVSEVSTEETEAQVELPVVIAEEPLAQEIASPPAEAPPFYYFADLKKMTLDGKLAPEQKYRLEEAKYGFEVYEVTEEVAAELDKVAEFLKNNQTITVEIGAHTESKGNDKNNLILSRYRAQAATAYLKKQGIEKSRLSYKGYGESEILNRCTNEVHCTPTEHAFNQRLEMKIRTTE